MDFHLPEHKTIVEFDGIQHFEPHTLGRMTDEEAVNAFQLIRKNDQRKNAWAKANNYKMIRIRYDEDVSRKLSSSLKKKLDRALTSLPP